MTRKGISIAAATALLLFASCSNNEERKDRREARHLFVSTFNLTAAYCDSMKLATDSAAVIRLDNDYQEKLTRLNLSVSPETDALLTEGENDTLYMLSRKYVMLRNKTERTVGINHATANTKNTNPQDSVRRNAGFLSPTTTSASKAD